MQLARQRVRGFSLPCRVKAPRFSESSSELFFQKGQIKLLSLLFSFSLTLSVVAVVVLDVIPIQNSCFRPAFLSGRLKHAGSALGCSRCQLPGLAGFTRGDTRGCPPLCRLRVPPRAGGHSRVTRCLRSAGRSQAGCAFEGAANE